MKKKLDKQVTLIKCDNSTSVIVYYYNIQELLLAKKVSSLIKHEIMSNHTSNTSIDAKIIFNENRNLSFKIKKTKGYIK